MSTHSRRLIVVSTSVLALALAGSSSAQQLAKPAPPQASINASAASNSASPDQLFSQWDADKNGQLSRKEFDEGWDQAREASLLSRLEAQFKSMDGDHNGLLDASEYANLPMIKRSGPAAPPLSVFDADKSGKIDFREYLALIQAMIKRNSEGAH